MRSECMSKSNSHDLSKERHRDCINCGSRMNQINSNTYECTGCKNKITEWHTSSSGASEEIVVESDNSKWEQH
jgi:hypothetical protein